MGFAICHGAHEMTNNRKLDYSAGWISISVNCLLFAAKFWVGIITGSIAIQADAWHTLSDSLTSVVVLLGIKVSGKPPDREHEFGHGRAELIASLVVAVLLGMVAFNILLEGIANLRGHETVSYGTVAVAVTIASVVVKEGLAQYSFYVGRKTGSKSVIADGWHHRSDAFSSLLILIGIFVGRYFWWLDAVLAMMIVILILYATYKILKSTIGPLLGEVPNADLIKKVTVIAERTYPEEISLHHFHIHRYGRHTELTFHVRLPDEMTLVEAHRIEHEIEECIRSELDMESTIHVDISGPPDKD